MVWCVPGENGTESCGYGLCRAYAQKGSPHTHPETSGRLKGHRGKEMEGMKEAKEKRERKEMWKRTRGRKQWWGVMGRKRGWKEESQVEKSPREKKVGKEGVMRDHAVWGVLTGVALQTHLLGRCGQHLGPGHHLSSFVYRWAGNLGYPPSVITVPLIVQWQSETFPL